MTFHRKKNTQKPLLRSDAVLEGLGQSGLPNFVNEMQHDKTNKVTAPSKDSNQPGYLPSLISVFAVRMKKAWVLSYPLCAQRRLGSDWADAQADLSLRWVHTLLVFVMLWLKCASMNTCHLYKLFLQTFFTMCTSLISETAFVHWTDRKFRVGISSHYSKSVT